MTQTRPACECGGLCSCPPGTFAFTDSAGLPRFRGRTCNIYGSVEDVVRGFAPQRQRGAAIYVYRTVDGLYDGAVVELADDRHLSPEFVGAELVHVVPAMEAPQKSHGKITGAL